MKRSRHLLQVCRRNPDEINYTSRNLNFSKLKKIFFRKKYFFEMFFCFCFFIETFFLENLPYENRKCWIFRIFDFMFFSFFFFRKIFFQGWLLISSGFLRQKVRGPPRYLQICKDLLSREILLQSPGAPEPLLPFTVRYGTCV